MASNKDIRKAMQAAERQGFSVARTRAGHFKVKAENGAIYVLPFSPGTARSERVNLKRFEQFKRENGNG